LYTLGIDIGSTTSKAVILKEGKRIVAKSLASGGAGTSGPLRVIKSVLEDSRLEREQIFYFLATGYGREAISWVNSELSELSCHAKAAYFLFPEVRTVIDIGGQDAKVLRIGEDGVLINFVMNTKCAAGTGRFLEVMARTMEVDIEELESMDWRSRHPVNISSTCTVFAESEVISQMAHNVDKCDIVKGIHRSAASRVAGLARNLGIKEEVVMTGGVAQNGGIVSALEEELGIRIKVAEFPQYAGALGAALFAYEKSSK